MEAPIFWQYLFAGACQARRLLLHSILLRDQVFAVASGGPASAFSFVLIRVARCHLLVQARPDRAFLYRRQHLPWPFCDPDRTTFRVRQHHGTWVVPSILALPRIWPSAFEVVGCA